MEKSFGVLIGAAAGVICSAALGGWYVEQKIGPPGTLSNPSAWALPVGISGDRCIMGSFVDSEKGFKAGAVYVYRFDGAAWVEEQKLTAADAQEYDYFGYGAAIDGDTIIVGAVGDDENGTDAGCAYVFRHNGSEWVQTQKLMPADRKGTGGFGQQVSVSGDLCVIGAWDWRGNMPSQLYIFHFDGERWNEETVLDFAWGDVGEFWGKVQLAPQSAEGGVGSFAVGAPGDDEGALNAGAVYLFDEYGSMKRKIVAPEPRKDLWFGSAIAYSGDVLAVSAPGSGGEEGCIYIYRPWEHTWAYLEPTPKLMIPTQDRGTVFDYGRCLAVDGDALITTAFRHVDEWGEYCDAIVYIYEDDVAAWKLKSRIEAADSRQQSYLWFGPNPWPVAIHEGFAMLGAHGSMAGDGLVYMYRRCPRGDLTGDCFVDMADVAVLAEEWMAGFDPWPRAGAAR